MGKVESVAVRWVRILGWWEVLVGGTGTLSIPNCMKKYKDIMESVMDGNRGPLMQQGTIIHHTNISFFNPFVVILFCCAPLLLLAGIGLLKFRPWGRIMSMVVMPILGFLPLAYCFLSYLQTVNGIRLAGYSTKDCASLYTPIFIPLAVIALSMSLPVLIFLNHPNVKEQFK